MSRLVSCDKCKEEFEAELKIKKLSDGIEENYFKCPECGHKYIAFVTDKKVRKEQQQIRQMYQELKGIKNKNDIRSHMARIDVAKMRLGKRMDNLKEDEHG